MNIFDTCIITASDEAQAEVFRALIRRRIEAGLYPREIDFLVRADPPEGRVGSGGGTLLAFGDLAERAGRGCGSLGGTRALVVHAGGESRRLPAYVPEGKLFAPLPSPSSALVQPVVLDHTLSLFLRYPWRSDELVVCSGDVVIDFDTELLDLPSDALCGFAAADSFDRGSRHGVFAFDPITGSVRDYFQKAPVATLEREARIEGRDACAVDLGIVSFQGSALGALGALYDSWALSRHRFDLYLELMTACLERLGMASYLDRVEVSSVLSRGDLEELYGLFHPCGLSGILARNPVFIHFGSAAEYPLACAQLRKEGHAPFYALSSEEIVPESEASLVSFSCEDAELESRGTGSYVEGCSKIRVRLEGENMLVGVRGLSMDEVLPRGMCIDERRLGAAADERAFRLVYHIRDSFKPVPSLREARFCGIPLDRWLEERGLSVADIGAVSGTPFDLYDARLFCEGSDASRLSGYWRVPDDAADWARWFRSRARISIGQANELSDANNRDAERARLRGVELASILRRGGFFAASAADIAACVEGGLDPRILVDRYHATDDPLLKAYRGAVVARCTDGFVSHVERIGVSFAPRRGSAALRVSVKLDQIVWARAPARLDIAGGWTDTPPYTNRYGGSVVNLAVDLNGQSPIQAFVRRTSEMRIRIHSIDLGVSETIEDTAALRAFREPSSPFALPKAALVLLGLGEALPLGASLAPVLAAAGGGLELTLLCAIPKGSGLGTSSILAGTVLGALERFFGIATTPESLYLQVLEIEQMLTTGGGWQDQIGGLSGGVKYIESRPGMKPKPSIHQLDPWAFEDPISTERMTLFYTGLTRLAKNILQEVVDHVNGMDRAYLFTHGRLRSLAQEARDAISLRDLPRLAAIVGESFRENKLIHASTTNEDIDALVARAAPYYRSMKLLGAGGGGFALFMSSDRGSAEALRELLVRDFENERARIVDFSLNKKGLQVTVS
jgi:galactokinase/mevalonate kinase-like predicted kinase